MQTKATEKPSPTIDEVLDRMKDHIDDIENPYSKASEYSLYYLMKEHKDTFVPLSPTFMKSFRQIDVTDSANIDVAIWHGLFASRAFWSAYNEIVEGEPATSAEAQPATAEIGPIVSKLVGAELKRARDKFPNWPTDPMHAIGVMAEELGELTQAALQLIYEPDKSSRGRVAEEAIQLATTVVRFITSLEKYEYRPSQQHQQTEELSDD